MSKSAAQQSTPPSFRGDTESGTTRNQRADFLVMVANMSWQLAVVVLVPVVGGVQLDKVFKTSPVLLFVGLALALVGTVLVMWRTMQVANTLPVPKLSAAQKEAIKKEYEAEDEE